MRFYAKENITNDAKNKKIVHSCEFNTRIFISDPLLAAIVENVDHFGFLEARVIFWAIMS